MAQVIDENLEQERRELEELKRCPGWARFQRQCQDNYSASAMLSRIEQQIAGVVPPEGSNQEQLATAREVIVVGRAVMAALNWPEKRIRDIEKANGQGEPPLVARRA
jgi:hypothetical protein